MSNRFAAAYLEKKNYPNVVGCDSIFINNTLTKNGMKELFRENLVSTPPGFPVTKTTDLEKMISDWGMVYPLFVKVSDSYGSVGIDDSSVCHDFEQVTKKCTELLNEFENLTVEEYIDGQEYSVRVLCTFYITIRRSFITRRYLYPEIVETRTKT